MIDTLMFILLMVLIGLQVLHSLIKKNNWNILVQMNSIGMKVLVLFLIYAMINDLSYILDIVVVLLVLNVVGTIIISRYNSKN
ncbi:MAG TPA: monovalent cation/H+ antiporter complex subunit F [Thermotogota bacterium]|nr:monovalent cation/H+ antiporter complex subunit F [Thermotogota bacterium]